MVTITQTPTQPFDQAYGPNPVTLDGMPVDPGTGVFISNKYVLQIWRLGELIADIRQSPNRAGDAIFDIQNVLQNYVKPSKNSIEETGWIGDNIATSANESTPYQLKSGYEDPVTGLFVEQGSLETVFLDFGGTKDYYEVTYPVITYIPSLITGVQAGCTDVLKQAKPFTDLTSYRLGSEITDGKPAWLTDNMRVYDHYVSADDMTTLSYYNIPSGTGPSTAANIEAFQFWQYDSAGALLSVDVLYNTQSDGGGPNTAPGDGIVPVYPYKAVTVGSGPKNFQDFTSSTSHYYVSTSAWTDSALCASTSAGLTDKSMHYVHRFNIVEPNCNDFPEYQFSWLNSYGFRDYYSFKKRKDRSVNIQRNEYLREAADYNSNGYDVNIYDRGTTVFSQQLQEEFTAFTDYISDADALYLEKLFTSADVKVRFNDAPGSLKEQWVPISLISANWTEKTYRKDKLFQYEIRFKRAHNLKSQRG